MAGKKAKARRIYVKAKHHVKTAKPSLLIIGGLAIPAAVVVTGTGNQYGVKGFSTSTQELRNRFLITYMGMTNQNVQSRGPNVGDIVQSTAVKAGALGFIGHWVANIAGVNRYLARMKAPFRL
jgi:hypothetical protein